MLTELQTIFDQYAETSREVRRKAPITAGLFGYGDDPRKHPCHDRFWEDLQAWMDRFLQSDPSRADARTAAEILLTAAEGHKGEDCYLYCIAAQQHVEKLLPLLSPEDCGEFRDWLQKTYPSRNRVPVQDTLLKHLGKRAKQKK